MSNAPAAGEPQQQSLYIPGIEANPQPGVYRTLVESAKARGVEYSKIWDLFAFQQDFTIHMGRFTHGLLRQPATISPGFRELIAAYTSRLNECRFCTKAHAAAAAELLGDESLVRLVLDDVEQAPVTEKERQLLRFVEKVTTNLPAVQAEDVQVLQAAGWDDEAIYYAITTCALFNFYNRWISATGVPEMSDEGHRQQGRALASRGYTRD